MRNRTICAILVMVVLAAGNVYGVESIDWSGWYAGAFGGFLNGKLTTNESGHFDTTGDLKTTVPLRASKLE